MPQWKIVKDESDWHLVWDYGSMRIAPGQWHYNIAVDAACDFMLRFQRNEWYSGCETVGDLMRICADRAKKLR